MRTARRAVACAAVASLGVLLAAGDVGAATDVQINGDAPGTVQNEVRITRNPVNQQNLVVAYNDSIGAVSSPLGVSHSQDGGLTWTDVQLAIPVHPVIGTPDDGIPLPWIFDPYIDSDPSGDVFAGYIASTAYGGPNGLYVERSSDGGRTWSGPTTIAFDLRTVPPAPDPAYRFNDRPDMAIDGAGNVHVVWIKDVGYQVGANSDIWFARSGPAGAPAPGNPTGLDFTGGSAGSIAQKTINDNPGGVDLANVPDVAVASDGTIYVAWIDVNVTVAGTKPGTLMIDQSTDNGVNFGNDMTIASITALPNWLSTASGLQDARSGSYPTIGVHPYASQVVYVAYAAVPGGGDEADIYFVRSVDRGFTWSAPIRVNDDATTTDQIHPMLAVTPDGTIEIAWYDKRNSATDDQWDVYVATSTDGGASFAPNVRVSDTTFATPTDLGSQPWMGEYLGLDVDATTAYLAFTSSAADGFGDLFFDALPHPTAGVWCAGYTPTMLGTPGPDALTGTFHPEVIVGLGGDDVIDGRNGRDILCGNGGNDTLIGGAGIDRMFGGYGADLMYGGLGNDRVFGQNGPDLAYGQGGDDRIGGGGKDDALYGGGGNDIIGGSWGKDHLDGGPGTDTLNGGPGVDTCVNGPTFLNCP